MYMKRQVCKRRAIPKNPAAQVKARLKLVCRYVLPYGVRKKPGEGLMSAEEEFVRESAKNTEREQQDEAECRCPLNNSTRLQLQREC